jgi:hypothetical protein
MPLCPRGDGEPDATFRSANLQASASGSARFAENGGGFPPFVRARVLLNGARMTRITQTARRVLDFINRLLGRTTALFVGFVAMVVGLAMIATIVFLPAGIVVGLLGFLTFVAGMLGIDPAQSER